MRNSKCIICESNKNVISHHISYDENETVPMCRSCHGKVHNNPDSPYYPVDLPPWRGRKVEVNYTPISVEVSGKKEESSSFLQSRLLEGFEEWQIRWILNLIKMPKGKNVGVAFCEKTEKPCFICAKGEKNYSLKPLIIRNVYVKKGECEDSDYCLNFGCEFSNSKYNAFQKYFAGKARKKNVEHLFELIRDVSSRAIDNLEDIFHKDGNIAYKKPPIEVNYVE